MKDKSKTKEQLIDELVKLRQRNAELGKSEVKRKRAEETVHESESYYRALYDNSLDAVLLTTPDGRILFANEAACRMLGRTKEEICQIGRSGIVDTSDPHLHAALEERARTGEFKGELTLIRKDGTKFPGEVSTLVFKDGHGHEKTSMTIRDITARKRAEEEIRQRSVELAALNNNARLLTQNLNLKTVAEIITRTCMQTFGLRLAWLLRAEPSGGTSTMTHFPDSISYPAQVTIRWDETPLGRGPTGRCLRSRKPVTFSDLATAPDYIVWREAALGEGFVTSAAFPLIKNEKVFGCLNLYSDQPGFFTPQRITFFETFTLQAAIALENASLYEEVQQELAEKSRLAEALHESEEKFRLVTETIEDVFWMSTPGVEKIVYISPAYERIWGRILKNLLKTPLSFVGSILPEDRDRYAKFITDYHAKGKPYSCEYRILRKDKSIRWIFERGFPIRDKDGKCKLMTVVCTDITERKRAEEEKDRIQAQLLQSEKMAGIGTLTSGIAHEFNNLLQIMSGHTEFALRTKRYKDMEEALNIVKNTSDRVSKIIKDLLTFSSKEALERKLSSIPELIDFVLSMTEEQLKKNKITVVREYGRVPKVEVNQGEIQQVFLNMLTNARDAMSPKGGKLEIRTKKVKDNVDISFTDTGIGIEEKNLGRVFEPFYTTKGSVGGDTRIQGIGLGLSVSYGIVEEHGGTIKVESEAGRETTFTIRLPVTIEKTKERVVKEKRKAKAEKTKPMNVLVVDDEEEISKMMEKWLSAEGHEVKSALTGEKALEQVKKEHFDVIFLDVIMPGIPSLIVLDEIKRISPKTKVVMITGRMLDKEFKKELKEKGAPGFIQKPFKLEDILGFLK